MSGINPGNGMHLGGQMILTVATINKEVEPTYTDPSDDQQSDAAMTPSTTSKTWEPRSDRPFGRVQMLNLQVRHPCRQAQLQHQSSNRRDTARRDYTNAAEDSSEGGATSSPHLMSLDEMSGR